MKASFVSFLIAMVLTCTAHAQTQQWGQVYFANHVLAAPPDRLVRGSDGTPVVGTYHAAQLYYGTNLSNLIPVTDPPATFRPQGTSRQGTWLGGMRTLVGVAPGTQTYLQVRFWHTDAGGTFEEASRINGPYRWMSSSFTYVPPPPGSSLEAHYMEGFVGLTSDCGGFSATPEILVQPTNQVVQAGQDVVISVVSTNYCGHLWQFSGTNITATNLPGSRFLILTNVQPSQAGDYRVIVGTPYFNWGGLVTSQVARLTVEAPPQWGEVFFASHVLPTPPTRTIYHRDGEPIVGTNIFAQLYYGTTDQNLIPLTNLPATFRLPGTSSPGTWRGGGMRTLVGIPPGMPVRLQVRIWDGNWARTFEEAVANGTFWNYGFPFFLHATTTRLTHGGLLHGRLHRFYHDVQLPRPTRPDRNSSPANGSIGLRRREHHV